jgi:hypothetical protein
VFWQNSTIFRESLYQYLIFTEILYTALVIHTRGI